MTLGCALLLALGLASPAITISAEEPERPNILFCVADDISWSHFGVYGETAIKTPHFDRIAAEGVLYTHAFCAAPSCTPSRSAVLTGQDIFRLGRGALLFGTLPTQHAVWPKLLEANGYTVGYTGKGWGPGRFDAAGRKADPCGQRWSSRKRKPPRPGMWSMDYAGNFEAFLDAKADDEPFCFWCGVGEAHRPYAKTAPGEYGERLNDVTLYDCFPDHPIVRADMLDYLAEVRDFDEQIGRMLADLERRGELERTLVIITSDHGMPFPRCKGNLYDSGTRVPLAIRFPDGRHAGTQTDALVSLIDIAPTILTAAGIDIPRDVTGLDLANFETARPAVITAFERHTLCRPGDVGYPARAIRTPDWLYIRNFEPTRWPGGHPHVVSAHQGTFGDVDNGATKTFLLEYRDDPQYRKFFELAMGLRPREELYSVGNDPHQLDNLAGNPEHATTLQRVGQMLDDELQRRGDPRLAGTAKFDSMLYYFRDYPSRMGTISDGLLQPQAVKPSTEKSVPDNKKSSATP